MFPTAALLSLSFVAIAYGQQVGTLTAESHPKLSVQQCTTGGSCSTLQRSVVLDSNWRWLHDVSGSTNCYTGNTWDATLCPDPTTCAANCALDGADYTGTYGITTSGNELNLKFVTDGQYSTNIGSRVYLLSDDDSTYEMFNLKNQEFTFDVDMSNLPCGLNGALYFVEMDSDGGASRFPTNKAGVQVRNRLLRHPVPARHQVHQRRGTDCGDGDERYDGICDKDGCDFNSFRMGDQTFLGLGKTVDTSQKFTVVTQFVTADNTTSGALSEIRRLYVQGGKVIANSKTNIAGMDTYDSITDDFCNAQKQAFGDTNTFEKLGGLAEMGAAFEKGMVLVMSIWDDHEANMLWLDSDYPTDADPSSPGVARGPCPTSSGVPTDVESQSANANVAFSNIKFGPIGSTYA
ncbi:hypothetical protein VTO73DRAFT_7315 [Trametes versicolor]